ncbi:secretin isoform X2 [Tympanuchus pallidicinctus]|uniref:secretin isoform X2 n=1 Tax=Tympanuchus pallidicinctus TaxID=109042 RepID=UPI0022875D8D|nr:secretin isoform X2 [Tympanuchus pallidicinctus]
MDISTSAGLFLLLCVGANMVSLMTALSRLIIPMIVLSHFSASLPSLERTERHADGLFHSELSKMNDNAFVQQLVKHLMGLKERTQRHSDGLFTSEYSKMRGNARVQKFIQNLMGRKRSNSGLVKTEMQEKERESSNEDLCYMWLYQSFLNSSHSDSDAKEAAAVTSRYICPLCSW